MTTLKEFLKPYYSEVQEFSNITLGIYLYRERNNPDLKPFIWIIQKEFNILEGIHPDILIKFCNDKLNCNTLEDLYIWINKFNSLYNDDLIDFIEPKIVINTIKSVDFSFLKEAIETSNLILFNTFKWKVRDNKYKLIDKIELDKILSYCPIEKLRFIPDARDCDDFALMFCGYLAYHGYGNIGIGYCEIYYFDVNNEFKYSHAINIIVLADGSYELVEPQSNKIITDCKNDSLCCEGYTRKIKYIQF